MGRAVLRMDDSVKFTRRGGGEIASCDFLIAQTGIKAAWLIYFFLCFLRLALDSVLCVFAGDDGRLYEGQGKGVVPQKRQRTRGFVPLEIRGGVFFYLGMLRQQQQQQLACTGV